MLLRFGHQHLKKHGRNDSHAALPVIAGTASRGVVDDKKSMIN